MEELSHQRIHQSCKYLSSLGEIRHRAHFGGYSLAVDNTIFALVSVGELYLRACEESTHYAITRTAPLLSINRRGRQVSLNYYFVNEGLWSDRTLLLQLGELSLNAARRDTLQRSVQKRLRDLPNVTCQLETSLCGVGITDVQTLRMLGAKACWLKLKRVNRHLSVNVLFALEGAINGLHEAALPVQKRRELIEWLNELQVKGAKAY
ncbi:TfoX/Sxy family DNA transformation protein [Kosakonia sp. BK9b]|uniref:TfoX/Sxy family DNA transformation protein n=1 Tax=Kosakonia sp. TaxID=1916651 RepID=UPI0028964ED8|nr:TfoX/Sxy family DNA transformation protein [Kosakonia sp.]